MFSSCSVVFGQKKGSDITGHWAEKQLNNWVDQGLIKGYSDGSFKPDKTITRGEFMSLANRAFGFTELTDIHFVDLKPSDFAYQDVQKAVKAGYIHGYQDQTIQAAKTLNRQELAVMIANLLNLKADPESAKPYSDADSIESWSKGAVGAIASNKIANGFPDGSFKPTKNITRAEAVVMLDRALQVRLVTYSEIGTYGPAEGVETIRGNVSITVDGITLQNVMITGDLILAESIGNGDVFLNNVTVKGTTTVNGGGANSVHVKDSVLVTVIVDKKTGDIRIVAEGKTAIENVILQSGAKLESDNASGTGFSAVTLTSELPKNSVVTLIGAFDSVDVASTEIKIDVLQGSINKLTVSEGAEDVSLNLGKSSKIVDLVLDAVLKVLGQGTIDKATFSDNAEDSSFEKPPTEVDGDGAPAPSPAPSSATSYTPIPTLPNGGDGNSPTTEKVAAPTANPVSGTVIENNSNVTLGTTTPGATIYYTYGPTPTISSVSGTSVNILGYPNTTVTVKAFAVKSGMANSEVATFIYTILGPSAPPQRLTANLDTGTVSMRLVPAGAILKVYDAPSDGNLLASATNNSAEVVTLNVTDITLTNGTDVYVSITEASKTESTRTAVTPLSNPSAAPLPSDLFANTLSYAVNVTVGNVPAGATVSVFSTSSDINDLSSEINTGNAVTTMKIPFDSLLSAGTDLYVSIMEPGKNESSRVPVTLLKDPGSSIKIINFDGFANDNDSGTHDRIELIPDGVRGYSIWAFSGLSDGDQIKIDAFDEILTYTLQSGDMAKLTSTDSNPSDIIGIEIGVTTIGVAYSGTALQFETMVRTNAYAGVQVQIGTLTVPGDLMDNKVTDGDPILTMKLYNAKVVFSLGVYGDATNSSPITPASFQLIFDQGTTGTGTGIAITTITKTDGTPLIGGETEVIVNVSVTGTPNGGEFFSINPANGSAIYDFYGHAMSSTETIDGLNVLNYL